MILEASNKSLIRWNRFIMQQRSNFFFSFKTYKDKSLLLFVQYSRLMHYVSTWREVEEEKRSLRGETWKCSQKNGSLAAKQEFRQKFRRRHPATISTSGCNANTFQTHLKRLVVDGPTWLILILHLNRTEIKPFVFSTITIIARVKSILSGN